MVKVANAPQMIVMDHSICLEFGVVEKGVSAAGGRLCMTVIRRSTARWLR